MREICISAVSVLPAHIDTDWLWVGVTLLVITRRHSSSPYFLISVDYVSQDRDKLIRQPGRGHEGTSGHMWVHVWTINVGTCRHMWVQVWTRHVGTSGKISVHVWNGHGYKWAYVESGYMCGQL